MKEITDFGSKILLTSHDLSFIKESTDECLLLRKGTILSFGKTKNLINKGNIGKLYKLDSLPDWVL